MIPHLLQLESICNLALYICNNELSETTKYYAYNTKDQILKIHVIITEKFYFFMNIKIGIFQLFQICINIFRMESLY